jgi:hypothetical protein
MNSVVSRHVERVAREKLKKERARAPHAVRGQLNIFQAQDRAMNERIKSGRFGLLREKDVEMLSEESTPVPVDEVPQLQVSFRLEKTCLNCKTRNKYIAVECRKCRGHFCYDKT